jgi:hypothetical protein
VSLRNYRDALADANTACHQYHKDADAMNEHDEQKALMQWAAWHEGQCPALALLFAIPNGGKRDPVTAVRLQREGVKPGVPDLCLPVPRQGWHGLFIELKAGKNKPTDKQLDWLERLSEQGYLAVVCWGYDEATATIKDYLGRG